MANDMTLAQAAEAIRDNSGKAPDSLPRVPLSLNGRGVKLWHKDPAKAKRGKPGQKGFHIQGTYYAGTRDVLSHADRLSRFAEALEGAARSDYSRHYGTTPEDSQSCQSYDDVGMAITEGFVWSAVYLMLGTFDRCPAILDCVHRYGTPPKNSEGNPLDWQDWTEWYHANTWKCPHCGTHNHNDADTCGNCTREKPN